MSRKSTVVCKVGGLPFMGERAGNGTAGKLDVAECGKDAGNADGNEHSEDGVNENQLGSNHL
jgi:hypothetical protein